MSLALDILGSDYVGSAVRRQRDYFQEKLDYQDTRVAISALHLLESKSDILKPKKTTRLRDKWGDIQNGHIRAKFYSLLMRCIICSEASGEFASQLVDNLKQEKSQTVAGAPFSVFRFWMTNKRERISENRRAFLVTPCRRAKKMYVQGDIQSDKGSILVTLARILAREQGHIRLSSWKKAITKDKVLRIPSAFCGYTEARTALLWVAHKYPHDDNAKVLSQLISHEFSLESDTSLFVADHLGKCEKAVAEAAQAVKECEQPSCWLSSDLAYYSAFVPALYSNGSKEEARRLDSIINTVLLELETTVRRFDRDNLTLYWENIRLE